MDLGQADPLENEMATHFSILFFFFLIKKKYLLGCTRSYLWHVGSSMFAAACRFFSCGK